MHMFRLQIQIQYVQIYINNIYGIEKKKQSGKEKKKTVPVPAKKELEKRFSAKDLTSSTVK